MNKNELKYLIHTLFDEREKIKKKFHGYIDKNINLNKKVLNKYLIEEEMIIGLLFSLQEKMLAFLPKLN